MEVRPRNEEPSASKPIDQAQDVANNLHGALQHKKNPQETWPIPVGTIKVLVDAVRARPQYDAAGDADGAPSVAYQDGYNHGLKDAEKDAATALKDAKAQAWQEGFDEGVKHVAENPQHKQPTGDSAAGPATNSPTPASAAAKPKRIRNRTPAKKVQKKT